ncbi:MAG TPA: hypothetical protein VGS58_12135 [Candidatus Sulfopaludibacter sp.]|nr:hypothetical protein [Candidatus Sulfopaludibacter sp.]
MLTTIAAAGVCAACKHDPGCIYENSSETTILQCEQFELAFPELAAHASATGRRERYSEFDGPNGFAGLCSNCENRWNCIYPKPEGGVWRCDEYL